MPGQRAKKASGIFATVMLLAAVVFMPTLGCTAWEAGPRVVKNPYAELNWERIQQYKGNFHCHTIYSDGRAEPDELIRMYAEAGYAILAITDHDNFYATRAGERDVGPTHETTWPWTRWIPEQPSRVWQHNGMETAAFYPDLGERGMLAVRGNELSQHPHVVSLFNDCGFPKDDQTDDIRMSCVEARGGIAFWAHPAAYVPPHRWHDRVFDSSMEKAIQYYGDFISRYHCLLGMEFTSKELDSRLPEPITLLDALLKAHYRDHDMFIIGDDDNHSKSVPARAVCTIVLAEELTADAVMHALQRGHTFVGRWVERQPRFKGITVDELNKRIVVDIDPVDEIVWIRNGQRYGSGPELDYSVMSDSVVRFEVKIGDETFYSQAFLIE